MDRFIFRAACALTLAVGFASCSPDPAPVSTSSVDQENAAESTTQQLPCGTDFHGANPGPFSLSQTFVAGRSGNLDRISLDLQAGVGTPDVEVAIQTLTDFGYPGGYIGAGSWSGPYNAAGGWTDIALTVPAPVVAGTTYAITVYLSACVSTWSLKLGVSNDAYPSGSVFYYSNLGEGPDAAHDFRFRTWVD